MAEAEMRMPARLAAKRRCPLPVDRQPERVLARSHFSAEAFNLFLHENYLPIFYSLEDVVGGLGESVFSAPHTIQISLSPSLPSLTLAGRGHRPCQQGRCAAGALAASRGHVGRHGRHYGARASPRQPRSAARQEEPLPAPAQATAARCSCPGARRDLWWQFSRNRLTFCSPLQARDCAEAVHLEFGATGTTQSSVPERSKSRLWHCEGAHLALTHNNHFSSCQAFCPCAHCAQSMCRCCAICAVPPPSPRVRALVCVPASCCCCPLTTPFVRPGQETVLAELTTFQGYLLRCVVLLWTLPNTALP